MLAHNTCPSCRWFGFRVALLVSIPFLTLTFRLLLVGYVSRPSSGLEWHLHGWANRAIALTISMWPWTCRRTGWRVQLSQCRVVGCALTQLTSSHTSTTPSTAPQRRCTQEHTHAPQAFTHAPSWPLCPCPCCLGYTCAHECGSPSVLFDCHSLAWVHGKPAVYFLTLTGYLCRHPTPVQPPPGPSQQGDALAPGDNGKLSSFFTIHASGFVCRHDNDTLHDTPREDNSRHATTHGATTVRGQLTT